MTPKQWDTIKYFDPSVDNFGDPERMNYELLLTLDAFRKYVGKPVIIHCGWENRETGWHPYGNAVDCHVEGMSLFNQFIKAQRFLGFTGIGIYPWWNRPGLHVDNRPKKKNEPRSFWGSAYPGISGYVKITKQFLLATL